MTDNRRYILNTLSAALIIAGICMMPSVIVSAGTRDMLSVKVLVCTMLTYISCGILGQALSGKTVSDIRPRIMFMAVIFTWLSLIVISTLTFYFGVSGISVSDAFMESAAAWTATGVSSFDYSRLPDGLLLWRSVCNWLGGIGMVLICLSLLPSRRYVGYALAGIEFPGPDFLKDGSDFRASYRKLVIIYGVLTGVQFILLAAAGMPIFTAVLSALSNTATAGLHHINNSVIISLSPVLKAIITVFAFLSSLSGLLFIYAIRKQFEKIKKSSELKVRLFRILFSIFAVCAFVIASDPSRNILFVLGDASVQVISFFSTSGFIAVDMQSWPQACIILILLQMFIGASSLSTGGGFKEARLIVTFKSISYTLYRHIHPNSVRTLSFDKKPMKSDQAVRANLFIALFMITYLFGALLLSLDNISLYEALTYSQSMITCTGTCAGSAAGSVIASDLSSFSKIVMGILMICGRLEIYPVLMLMSVGFWKSDSSV